MSARSQSGFTLLEALIAFAIAAMALGVLFQGASAALHATETATRLEGAVGRARSHLAEATTRLGSAGERVEQGNDGALYRYRVSVTPLQHATARRETTDADPAIHNTVRLYRLEVEESWPERGRERVFRLQSERLFVASGGNE